MRVLKGVPTLDLLLRQGVPFVEIERNAVPDEERQRRAQRLKDQQVERQPFFVRRSNDPYSQVHNCKVADFNVFDFYRLRHLATFPFRVATTAPFATAAAVPMIVPAPAAGDACALKDSELPVADHFQTSTDVDYYLSAWFQIRLSERCQRILQQSSLFVKLGQSMPGARYELKDLRDREQEIEALRQQEQQQRFAVMAFKLQRLQCVCARATSLPSSGVEGGTSAYAEVPHARNAHIASLFAKDVEEWAT